MSIIENDDEFEVQKPGLWHQIKEDWVAHGCDWTKPGFRAVIIHRFGVWRMTIKSKLIRAPFSLFIRLYTEKYATSMASTYPTPFNWGVASLSSISMRLLFTVIARLMMIVFSARVSPWEPLFRSPLGSA